MERRVKAVLDTNILIDYLRGFRQARVELDLYEEAAISLITWMEVLCGASSEDEERAIRAFLLRFKVQPVGLAVAERAVRLRRQHKLRLPDAIIWATANDLGRILVTRNTRDFPAQDPGIRVPYQL